MVEYYIVVDALEAEVLHKVGCDCQYLVVGNEVMKRLGVIKLYASISLVIN